MSTYCARIFTRHLSHLIIPHTNSSEKYNDRLKCKGAEARDEIVECANHTSSSNFVIQIPLME